MDSKEMVDNCNKFCEDEAKRSSISAAHDKEELVDVEIRLPVDLIAKIKQIGMDVETAVTTCMTAVSKSFRKKRYFHGCNREHKPNPPRKPGWTLVKYPVYMKHMIMFQSSPTINSVMLRQTGKSISSAGLFINVMNLFVASRLKKSDPLRRDIYQLTLLASTPGTTKEMCEERIKELLAKYQFAE
jgi:hypothetical protein